MPNAIDPPPRAATLAEAGVVAGLLDRFNREFDTPSPGPAVLTDRLERLLSGREVVALVAGEPALGVALLTLRPNVWCEGPVGLLVDGEDVDARRFYERHGYSNRDPGQTQPQLYYHRDLVPAG